MADDGVETSSTALFRALTLICFDLHHKRFTRAFQDLTSAESLLSSDYTTSNPSLKDLSLYHDIKGSYLQLICKLGAAESEYMKAIELYPDNIDSRLKLIMLYTEFGEFDKV